MELNDLSDKGSVPCVACRRPISAAAIRQIVEAEARRMGKTQGTVVVVPICGPCARERFNADGRLAPNLSLN